MSDYSKTSVGELRKMLVESGKYTDEDVNKIKGKSNLVDAVLHLNEETENNEDFENLLKSISHPTAAISTEDITLEDEESEKPDYNSPEWHNYVMSKFSEDEKDGDYPTLYGLRRVAELLLGPIVQSGPTHITPPLSENSPGRATVVYTIVFDWNGCGVEKAFSSLGGSYSGNTDETYAIFPEAIAESRAEARALRKALKLKVVAAEEMAKNVVINKSVEVTTTGEWNETDIISQMQIMFIEQKTKEMNIDIKKLVKKETGKDDLNQLDKGLAKQLIDLLNKYQSNTKNSLDIPEDIK